MQQTEQHKRHQLPLFLGDGGLEGFGGLECLHLFGRQYGSLGLQSSLSLGDLPGADGRLSLKPGLPDN